jgi:hypothetical protein
MSLDLLHIALEGSMILLRLILYNTAHDATLSLGDRTGVGSMSKVILELAHWLARRLSHRAFLARVARTRSTTDSGSIMVDGKRVQQMADSGTHATPSPVIEGRGNPGEGRRQDGSR